MSVLRERNPSVAGEPGKRRVWQIEEDGHWSVALLLQLVHLVTFSRDPGCPAVCPDPLAWTQAMRGEGCGLGKCSLFQEAGVTHAKSENTMQSTASTPGGVVTEKVVTASEAAYARHGRGLGDQERLLG